MSKKEVVWKPIKNYSEFYEISSDGKVRSKERAVFNKIGEIIRINKPKEISPRIGLYKMVGLNKNRKQMQISIHRLVAIHFLENPNNKPQVNHKDGDKMNNNFENLEWVTAGENQKHAFSLSLKKPTWLGKKLPLETRNKMAEAKKGNTPWNKGIKQSDYCKAPSTQTTMNNKQKDTSSIKNKPEIKFIKKPNYHNEEVLIHCINSQPHSLLFDRQFISYDEKTVVNLCEDLEANFDYLIALLEHSNNQESLSRTITIANSLVWASLFHIHDEFVPEKYKQEDS